MMKLLGLQSDIARSVAILALGTFAVGTDAFILSAFLPDMAADLGVSVAQAGYAVTVFAASYAVLSPVLATLTVRFERRKLLIGAIVALVLTDIAAALAPTFEMLLVSRIFAAAAAASFTPNAAAMAASLAPLESRGRALSVVVGGMTIATAIGVPLGNLASHALSWRGALLMVAAVGILAAVGVFFRLPPMAGGAAVPLRKRLALLKDRKIMLILPVTVLGVAACYVPYAFVLVVLDDFGIGASYMSIMLLIYGIGAVLGNIVCGAAVDRWDPRTVLLWAFAFMAVGFALMLFIGGLTGAALYLTVGFLMLLWGGTSWCQAPPQQARLIDAAPSHGPMVVSLNSSAIYVGVALGTTMGSATIDISTTVNLAAALFMSVLVWICVKFMRP
tara:strand:- start:45280 stop:46449 length:1170 start_codon:yes stop_codon:yes gene_type:complete